MQKLCLSLGCPSPWRQGCSLTDLQAPRQGFFPWSQPRQSSAVLKCPPLHGGSSHPDVADVEGHHVTRDPRSGADLPMNRPSFLTASAAGDAQPPRALLSWQLKI